MIEWLSDNFSVNINAVVLNYVKTASGDELLTKTSIISEEFERERVKKQKKFQIPMSDEPGTYPQDKLHKLLREYLSRQRVTNQRLRDVLLPVLLKRKSLRRSKTRTVRTPQWRQLNPRVFNARLQLRFSITFEE